MRIFLVNITAEFLSLKDFQSSEEITPIEQIFYKQKRCDFKENVNKTANKQHEATKTSKHLFIEF